MIISASRRTDIPAFFSQWFMDRIREGFVQTVNPFNANQVREYSLHGEDVDIFVFWSKNPKPMIPHLVTLDGMGYNYYFQYTLNDYPREFEPYVPPLDMRLDTFKELSTKVGPKKVIWRWDPIVMSSITPASYLLEHLENVAQSLEGYTERLVISLLDFYGKVSGRFKDLSKRSGIRFRDIALPEHNSELVEIANRISEIGKKHGMKVYSCAEALNLDDAGILHGACIDGALIRDLFGINRSMQKDRGQRPECLCVESVDIGAYNTCSHQCSYCYANFSEAHIRTNLSKHQDSSPLLVGVHNGPVTTVRAKKGLREQPSMFEDPPEKP